MAFIVMRNEQFVLFVLSLSGLNVPANSYAWYQTKIYTLLLLATFLACVNPLHSTSDGPALLELRYVMYILDWQD